MSMPNVITIGFGPSGTIGDVITLGFGFGAAPVISFTVQVQFDLVLMTQVSLSMTMPMSATQDLVMPERVSLDLALGAEK